LELREEFCTVLRALPGVAGVHAADIQGRTPFEAGSFDRIVAIHVLEHLRDLPRAIDEISRILADDGIFDIVLPCEGGAAYYLARQISAKPFFERRFGMSYDPIIASEHVNTLDEVLQTLEPHFVEQSVAYFPLGIPINTINLAVALRMKKR
jgi:SAM-dependent methyltransferase